MKAFFHLTRTSALRKAPAENLGEEFSEAQRRALTSGRFALRPPPPAPPPPPPTPPPTPDESETVTRRPFGSARFGIDRFGPTPDESETVTRRPLRMPLLSRQPVITYETDSDEDPLTRFYRNYIREEHKEKLVRLARQHVESGTLTDGSEFLNLGALAKHQTDLIAKEYVKWRESGGGPLPDLSKYENPVARYKDGSAWDYLKTAARLTPLHEIAGDYDPAHKNQLHLSSNGNLSALDPQYIWSQLELRENPGATNVPPGRKIFLDELKRTGLHPSQYPLGTRGLINLGLHHQQLSRLYAQGGYTGDDYHKKVSEEDEQEAFLSFLSRHEDEAYEPHSDDDYPPHSDDDYHEVEF